MTTGAGVQAAFEAAARARVTMVVGASDTGKTTLTAVLASALAARGERVAAVDADLGQSEIGPPTTVGLGRVPGALARLGDVEVLALEFVGSTSPARAVRQTAEATGALVERARGAGFERIVVDTSGLVAGPFGRWLKRAKIDLVRPDLVVVVERGQEGQAIAHEASLRPDLVVLRVSAAAGVRRRWQDERRRHRADALAAYFATAAALSVGALAVRRLDARATPVALGPDDAGLLVGVHDAAGQTRGIGRILGVDANRQTLVLATPVAADVVAGLTVGRERYGADR